MAKQSGFKSKEDYAEYKKQYKYFYKIAWQKDNPDYAILKSKQWRQENPEKHRAQKQRRRAKLKGWILKYPNPFDDSEEVEEHHIDATYVVYLPKDLHRLGDAYAGRNPKLHILHLSYIVKQIYGDA